jgi:hypothetical protein
VTAGVEQQHLAFAGTAETALAMSRSAAFSGRTQSGGAQQLAHGFAMKGKALDLTKFLGEVMIVEPGIGGAGQMNDLTAHPVGQAARTGATAADVRQSRLPVFAHAFLKTFDLPCAEREQFGGSGARQVSFEAS